MSLSDICLEFQTKVEFAQTDKDAIKATNTLKEYISWYKEPPFDYGEELPNLEKACDAYLNQQNGETWSNLCKQVEDTLARLNTWG